MTKKNQKKTATQINHEECDKAIQEYLERGGVITHQPCSTKEDYIDQFNYEAVDDFLKS